MSCIDARLSEEFDQSSRSVKTIHGRAKAPTKYATRGNHQFNGKLQEIRVKQHLVLTDATPGIAIETTTFRVGVN